MLLSNIWSILTPSPMPLKRESVEVAIGAIEKVLSSIHIYMDEDYEKRLQAAADDLEAYLLAQ